MNAISIEIANPKYRIPCFTLYKEHFSVIYQIYFVNKLYPILI